ncbi:hypothetical protein NDU88_002766 [Pleurodeles waltl]|uniref:Uncharacterized protein n=1 Tax=Pleurodeles waltl TaxID=8319 RepID=A0AAV7W4Z3_PLEWA|nr:hypothetical protein NDU88_002766 [Pleurodeles waltl]
MPGSSNLKTGGALNGGPAAVGTYARKHQGVRREGRPASIGLHGDDQAWASLPQWSGGRQGGEVHPTMGNLQYPCQNCGYIAEIRCTLRAAGSLGKIMPVPFQP